MGCSVTPKEPQESRITKIDFAVLEVKSQRDVVCIEKENLERKVAKDAEEALYYVKLNQPPLAKMALRMKKHHSALIEQCNQYLLQFEKLISSLETAEIQNELYRVLKIGNEALKAIKNDISVEAVKELMDETQELHDYHAKIESLLHAHGVKEADDAITAELDRVEAEAREETKKMDQLKHQKPKLTVVTNELVTTDISDERAEISSEDSMEAVCFLDQPKPA